MNETDHDDAAWQLIKAWAQAQDPREPRGAYVLIEYGGNEQPSFMNLGPEDLAPEEVIRRMVWLADVARMTAPGLGYYPAPKPETLGK